MANQWFKFYGGEYLSDPKIERLSPIERSCWITLMCLASMSSEGVVEFLTVETLLNKSGIQFDPYHPEEWEKALSVLLKFQKMRMISLDEEGEIIITNWDKRQERVAQTPYERVKKHRENKKKIVNDNENDNGDNADDNDRIEENRKEEKKEKALSYLKEIPENDLEEMYNRFDCDKGAIKSKAESLMFYCQSKGRTYKNYHALLLNALKKDFPERKGEVKSRKVVMIDGKPTLLT